MNLLHFQLWRHLDVLRKLGERIYLLLPFIWLINLSLFAQIPDLKFEPITTDDGLPNGEINQILQDQRGFMWFATWQGVIRYDGYSFVSFKPDVENSNSISSKLIYCIQEDPTGNIWVGTTHGLNFFDRTKETFTHIIHEPQNPQSLLSNWIIEMAVDQDSNLWVATDQGLSKIILDEKRTPISYKHFRHIRGQDYSLPSNEVISLEVDHKNRVWVGTMKGLVMIDESGKIASISKQRNSVALPEYAITVIFEDRRKNIWIGTKGGRIFSWNQEEPELMEHHIIDAYRPDSDLYISALCEDAFGNLWIGVYEKGLVVKQANDAILHITYDSENASSLSSKAIKSLYQDKSGVLWIGSGGAGMYKLDLFRKPFTHYKHKSNVPQSLNSNTVMCFDDDPLGRVWIGTKEGINVFDPATEKFVHYENISGTVNPLISATIWSVFADKEEGVVWLGGHDGLIRVNLKKPNAQGKPAWIEGDLSKYFRHIPFMNSNLDAEKYQVRVILKDRQGYLWVGTYYGLYVLAYQNNELKILKHYLHDPNNPNSISNNIIISLLEDRNGDMWIGTRDGGLNYLALDETGRGEQFMKYMAHPTDGALTENEVACIHEDRLGNLWIGTAGGRLHKIEAQQRDKMDSVEVPMLHFDEKDGLIGDEVFGILEDDHSNLWISTNQGIFKFNPGLPEDQRFKQFTKDHGLQGNMFFTGAFLKSTDGKMYFGGRQGFNVFHPDSIRENLFLPSVAITKLSIFNEPVMMGESVGYRNVLTNPISETDQISLSYKANNFSLEFAALHYTSPQNNRYAYQLEGYDEDWIYTDANRRFASYNNLKPGTYTFKVKAANADNIWTQENAQLVITMRTPPWKSWWAISLYGMLLLFFLFAFRYYSLNRIRLENELEIERRENQKTKELNQMKLNFFTQISHEFRTPLTLIIGPVQDLVEKGKKFSKKEILQHLSLIHLNSQHLLRLIDQLLFLSKSEYGKIQFHPENGNLIVFTQQVYDAFDYLARQKNINLVLDTDLEDLMIWLDWDKMEKIFNNLLSNALKFTPSDGSIYIRIYPKYSLSPFGPNTPEKIQIEVQDTGIGILEKDINRIFDSFYQASTKEVNNADGYGIGLALTKRLVEMHKGTIRVKSEEGKGTIFSIRIPYIVDDSHATPNEGHIKNEIPYYKLEQLDAKEQIAALPILLSPPKVTNDHQSIILIVEDNTNIRDYLKKHLEGKYKILEASNGEEGWKQALEHIPNIIISDVMMPVMDGIKFCRLIKEDERTNHIPIILLTAKSAIEHKIEGLQSGADAYLAKPFHPKHLEVRIQKLIEQRVRLQNKYKAFINDSAQAINKPLSEDEIFLEKVRNIIEDSLADSTFNVKLLEKELGMSHMQLYRKLKALNGQSANEFIRSVRLKKAASLFQSSSMNVNEVAYQVGFNSPSYFIRCFREEYGVLPKTYSSEFRKSRV